MYGTESLELDRGFFKIVCKFCSRQLHGDFIASHVMAEFMAFCNDAREKWLPTVFATVFL